MRIIAVVAAAGEGRRIGGPKALLRLREKTFLAHVCELLASAGADLVVAVLGCEAERVAREAGLAPGVLTVVNERWREGMLTSVWRGLDAAEDQGADAILLHPVDTPLVAPATVRRVWTTLAAGRTIVLPSHGGHRGHPAGFARRVFGELRSAAPEVGARAVLYRDSGRIAYVEGDPGCLVGIDTPADYAARFGSPPTPR